MKKLMGFLMVLLLCSVLIVGALIFTGYVTIDEIKGMLGFDENSAAAPAPNAGTRTVNQLADHQPPSGEGSILEGDLPEDQIPDAESRYTFSAQMYPYRAMLTASEQSAYDQIYANAMELVESLPLHTPIPTDYISRVMSAVFYDHPELFWMETAYRYNYNYEDNVVAVTLIYNSTAQDIGTHRGRYNAVVQEVVAGARQLSTPVEQEKYVHDYLLDNVSYQLDSPLNQSAYSALVYGQTVCAGYARAFQHIMLELGIPCYYCVGYAGEAHAWNIVELEDGYYHVDVAWDDPLNNPVGQYYYNYFNITDAQIASDHTRDDLSTYLPSCNATGYSYNNVFGSEDDDPTAVLPGGTRTPEALGYDRADAIASLNDYYAVCTGKLADAGAGSHSFTLLLRDSSLLDRIFELTESGEAMERYVQDAADRMGWSGYSASVSLQAEELDDGYWLLSQQVQLQNTPAPAGQSEFQEEVSAAPPEPEEFAPADGGPRGGMEIPGQRAA